MQIKFQRLEAVLEGKIHMEKFNLGSNKNACMGLWFVYITLSGEGNGNPLQYSCLENSLARGASWATVHGVTKFQTRLKRLSSSITLSILQVKVVCD